MQTEDPSLTDDGDPVAVIGFSLRFPQDAATPEGFWSMLEEGRCASTDFPDDRLNIEAFYNKVSTGEGQLPLRGGHFLKDDIGEFDANFFSATPAEAMAMDPQQRIMLETSYRALENSGLTIGQCSGTQTSVYTATFTDDYKSTVMRDPENIPKFSATGLSGSMLANRISWFYNLHGPSMNLDSACSSSLSALHLACSDLHQGTSKMALVGGCNLVFHPDFMLIMTNMSFLSRDSRCWSFDHKANGYARGDGFGVVVLKKLSQAIQDGDTIRAVIRATGLNQDGRTNGGITQPSGAAQSMLIDSTFSRMKLDKSPVRFFEAHGTGTAIGDPTEASAIGSCFRSHRSDDDPLYIGAVKSNIGHLEGGSGLAGLIKTIMILERGVIPPNSGLEKVNPKIDTDHLRIRFPTDPIPWPSTGLRRACINSFGFGGSNAVCIVDDALHYLEEHALIGNHRTLRLASSDGQDHPEISTEESSDAKSRLLVFSAADEIALNNTIDAYESFFERENSKYLGCILEDLAHTLSAKRTMFAWRSFAVIRSGSDLRSLRKAISKPQRTLKGIRIPAFVFTGQGAQYPEMGKGLLSFPFYKARISDLDRILCDIGCTWSLEAALKDPNTPFDNPEYSQTACTALQIGMVDLLRHFNISPVTVVGHSSGEIAAAYCARILSDRSAMAVAFHRGRLARKLPEFHTVPQGMLAVGLGSEEVLPYLERLREFEHTSAVQVACINSPKSTTLTGNHDHLHKIETWLQEDKCFSRMLPVNVAYHSDFMKVIEQEYLASLQFLLEEQPADRRLPMISSVNGAIVPSGQVCRPEYWVRNLVSQVRFSTAMTNVCVQSKNVPRSQLGSDSQSLAGITDLIEIGPHSTLQGPILDILKATESRGDLTYTAVLQRKKDAHETTLKAMASLWTSGYPLDVQEVNGLDRGSRPALTNLPEYRFNHSQRHWFEDRVGKAFRFRSHARHELLGSQLPISNPWELRWRNIVKLDKLPWLQDHQINDDCIVPGAAMIEMAVEAMKQVLPADKSALSYELLDIDFLNALQLEEDAEGTEIHICLSTHDPHSLAQNSSWYQFRVFSFGADWTEHCQGKIRANFEPVVDVNSSDDELVSLLAASDHSIDKKTIYEINSRDGVQYGHCFQVLDDVRFGTEGTASATVGISSPSTSGAAEMDLKAYTIHPTTLDGLFQLVFPALNQGGQVRLPTMVLSRVGRIVISSNLQTGPDQLTLAAGVRSVMNGYRGTQSDLVALSDRNQDRAFVILDGYETTFVSVGQSGQDDDATARNLISHMEWQPDIELMTNEEVRTWCQSWSRRDSAHDRNSSLNRLIKFYMRTTIERLADLNILPETDSEIIDNYITWMKTQTKTLQDPLDGHCHEDLQPREEFAHDTELMNRLEADAAEYELGPECVAIGRHLVDVLDGNLTIQEVLEETSSGKRSRHPCLPESDLLDQAANYISLLVHKYSSLRILEIGLDGHKPIFASMSSRHSACSTNAILHYTQSSTDAAQEIQKLLPSDGSLAEVRALNIQNDPTSQGLKQGFYDVVFLPCCLANRDLDDRLRRMQTILKPEGKMVLLCDSMPDSLEATFARGLSKQYRVGLQTNALAEILIGAGYTGIDLMLANPPSLDELGVTGPGIVISSRKRSDIIMSPQPSDTMRINVVHDGTTERQKVLATALKSQIEVRTGYRAQISDLKTAVSNTKPADLAILLLEISRPFLSTIAPVEYDSLKTILTSSPSVIWATQQSHTTSEPEMHLIDGFARTLRAENPNLKLLRLNYPSAQLCTQELAQSLLRYAQYSAQRALEDMENEVEIRGGIPWSNRLVPSSHMNQHLKVKTASHENVRLALNTDVPLRAVLRQPGILDGITYRESSEFTTELGLEEVVISMRAIGISPDDLKTASGLTNSKDLFSEGAGVIENASPDSGFTEGDRVMLYSPNVCGNRIRCNSRHVWPMPDGLSFTEAASMPLASVTSWHVVKHSNYISAGDVVLIHRASGSTAQVLVKLFLNRGVRVLVTVADDEERKLIRHLFDLQAKDVLHCQDKNLASYVLSRTSGTGVDLICNFDIANERTRLFEAMATLGHFLDLSGVPIDIHQDSHHTRHTKRNVTYTVLNPSHIFQQRPEKVSNLLTEVSTAMLEGLIRPPSPLWIYPADQIGTALHSFQSRVPSGKVVLDLDPQQVIHASVATKSSTKFDAEATYVVSGGFGGLGRSVLRWMVDHGARNFLVLSRSGLRSAAAEQIVQDLSASGANIEAPPCDITCEDALKDALEKIAPRMPPIRGCIQCTMVLRDAIFDNMTHEDFMTGIRPKVLGSWNLHRLLPSGLDFFILFSSVAGIIGGTSQANYAAGNSFEDAVARHRTSIGEKAVSLDLGMMVSEGVVAETEGMLASLRRLGYFMDVFREDFHAILDYYCNPKLPILAPDEAQVVIGIESPAGMVNKGLEPTHWMMRPVFRHFKSADDGHGQHTGPSRTSLEALLRGSTSLEEASEHTMDWLMTKISQMLGMDRSEIEVDKPIHVNGVNSLAAIELRNAFDKKAGANIAIFEILGDLTMKELCRYSANKSKFWSTP